MRQLKISKQITMRDGESVNRYFQDIVRYQTLSAEEEAELCRRIKKGDKQALEQLIAANLRFVVSVAKQYQNQGVSFPDLINEGNIGLVKAAKKYDETKGFKFISYAVWWIRQSIIQAIAENARTVRLPSNRIVVINKIAKAITLLEQKYEREPSETEVADFLHMSQDSVKLANEIKKHLVSFDMPVSSQDEEFNLYDIIQTGDIPSPDTKMMQESLVTNIHRIVGKLNTQEADILTMLFGLDNSPAYSLQDVADKLNISVERVRQIRKNGLSKLKKIFRKHPYFS